MRKTVFVTRSQETGTCGLTGVWRSAIKVFLTRPDGLRTGSRWHPAIWCAARPG